VVEPGRVIAIEGPSGAGKSTVARTAARSFGWVLLPEAFDRLDPPPDLRFRNPAQLLDTERSLLDEERRRYQEASERRRRGETVVADTGFLGPITYTAGLVALGAAPRSTWRTVRRFAEGPARSGPVGLPDLVVYLDVPSATRRRRAASDAERHPADLRQRHRAVGRVERRFYRDLAAHGAPGQVLFVRASGSPRALAGRIRTLARSTSTRPSARTNLSTVLDRLGRLVRAPADRRRKRVARHR